MSKTVSKIYKGLSAAAPFKLLELQLKLEDLEKKWEIAKASYIEAGDPTQTTEILKITLEKIRIVSQINDITEET
jgi:hypothetical protein